MDVLFLQALRVPAKKKARRESNDPTPSSQPIFGKLVSYKLPVIVPQQ